MWGHVAAGLLVIIILAFIIFIMITLGPPK